MTKVLVSLDDGLLRRIDRAAQEKGLSRSAYLAEIARAALGEQRGPGASPRSRAAMRRLDDLFARNPGPPEDSTDAIRAERDAR
jgi:hypothetical protein